MSDHTDNYVNEQAEANGNEAFQVFIKFSICGNLRFISHAETIRVFQRAFARSGINIAFSHGFNPRPKLSLPLPRSVGVEACDELLCVWIDSADANTKDEPNLKAEISAQLPDGLNIISVEISKDKKSLQPVSAEYLFTISRSGDIEKVDSLKQRIEYLISAESLDVERCSDGKKKSRRIDVRKFLESIEFNDNTESSEYCIIVRKKINSLGSIRVDEILTLLGLSQEDLALPIIRSSIVWHEN